MNILVVEDSCVQRKALVEIIRTNEDDIIVYEADNVGTAINILENNIIDLFILDINLNGESGMDIAKKIRQYNRYKLTGIVFVTAEITHIIEAVQKANCYNYITKPYDENQIKKIINVFSNKNIEVKKSEEYKLLDLGNDTMVKVYYKDIIFIEYYLRSCKVHTKKEIYSVKGVSLNKLIDEIKYKKLVQSHRSYAINIDYIYTIEKCYGKLWNVSFCDYCEKAKIGYNYRKQIISMIEKN